MCFALRPPKVVMSSLYRTIPGSLNSTCRTCHGVDFCSHIRQAHCYLSVLQIMSSTTPLHVATMPLTFLRCLTFPRQPESEYERHSSGRFRPLSLASIKKISLSVVNQVSSKSFEHLPMFLSWRLRASSQYATHETTIWSISCQILQQATYSSERLS